MTDTLLAPATPAHDAFVEDLLAWREKRVASLTDPYGWWSITSLNWLEEGPNLVGSGAGVAVRLASRCPALAATLVVSGDSLTITPAPGAALSLDGAPLTGPLTVHADQAFMVEGDTPVRVAIVRRGDLWGVRVYDPEAARGRNAATDVAWFEPQPGWVVEAELLAADPGETVPVSNVIGQVSMQPVAGRVRFQHGGATHTLLATHAGGGRLFINFRDASNEDLDRPSQDPVSYSGGRFLITDAPTDGRVALDFNRAYHPPCAHTPYATCPMPTRGNELPFRVTAGERVA